MKSIVFIDSTVTDYQSLAQGVCPNTQVVIVNGDRDGIQQITVALQQQEFSTIHIVSHGSPGCIYLGNSQLSLETLDYYTSQLNTWLTQEILIYGCNVAAGDAGEEFITRLQQITQASIAASATIIGKRGSNTNWQLPITTGEITSPVAFTATVRQSYQGSLATFTVDSTNDGNGGNRTTLREAIEKANNRDGKDTIIFDLSRGAEIDLDEGKIDITDDLVIKGPGANDLTIFNDRNSHIFVIKADDIQVEMSDLTLSMYSEDSQDAIKINGDDNKVVLKKLDILTDGVNDIGESNGITINGDNNNLNINQSSLVGLKTGLVVNNESNVVKFAKSLADKNQQGIEVTGKKNELEIKSSDFENTVNSHLNFKTKNSDLLIDDSVFRNGDKDGITINGDKNSLEINDTQINNNDGKGIDIKGSEIDLEAHNLTVERNQEEGLNIGNGQNDIVINFSTFDRNNNGGLVIGKNNQVSLENTTISRNQASDFNGGGIFNSGELEIINTTIVDNEGLSGGGIANDKNGEITVTNSTISDNFARDKGGGIFNQNTVTLTNVTITLNDASSNDGDGVYTDEDSKLKSGNTIIADNSVNDIDFAGSRNSIDSQGYNLIGFGNGSREFDASGDQTRVNDPRLRSLADNGGSTETHALRSSSSAIDAGDNDLISMSRDQRGYPRIASRRIDIGAYEYFNLIEAFDDNAILIGTNQSDEIIGSQGDDDLFGRRSNDIINGQNGEDILSGSNGDDILVGGFGDDTLTGGTGDNFFTFEAFDEGVDLIEDFTIDQDLILVSAEGFGGGLIAGESITKQQFVVGNEAKKSSHRFIYNDRNGRLFFDRDGSGGLEKVELAILDNTPLLIAEDIVVF